MIEISQGQTLKTANATIRILGDGIVHILYAPNTFLELEDFEEPLQMVQEFSSEYDIKAIIEFPMHTHASPEARKFAMETELPVIAEAVVFKTLAQRIIIRFYLMVHKQKHPVKIFTETDEAIKWLQSLSD